ncbi:MAG: DUF3536 domain-containing protein [Chitinivibrionales bacterium]|nr:DUF3536 domain-containing protein [Chitinivibrionales bacterium]
MTGPLSKPPHGRPVIIHGHFYQPPRENPWLNVVEKQDSASPSHDWNERVFDECYRPNAYSRLLTPQGMIRGIYNNYRNMSFNFGPTLFSWIERVHPDVAERIIAADEESLERLNGHGNALAQVFNHIIMPLASRRDQLTQIRWAKQFFKERFGREPQGIWLAETAINNDTVRCLIEEGIRFTILSPTQAAAFRMLDEEEWTATDSSALDARRPYRIFPDEGNDTEYLDVFFFDEALSRSISFGDTLTSSDNLATGLRVCFDTASPENQVTVVATDGETFGHHKAYGDMCLAYFFAEREIYRDLEPVNFGWFLEKHPPRFAVRLSNANSEGTAWSCAHGTGRWYRNCGCHTGGDPSWNQAWRTPLRSAFEELQISLNEHYGQVCGRLGIDAWQLRDSYAPLNAADIKSEFEHSLREHYHDLTISSHEVEILYRLLQSQKYMLYAYTSCGWFFADVTGIETVQNMAYAARALQLGLPKKKAEVARELMLCKLQTAHSNLPGMNGKTAFDAYVAPQQYSLARVAFAQTCQKMLLDEQNHHPPCLNFDIVAEEAFRYYHNGSDYHVWTAAVTNATTTEKGRFVELLKRTSDHELEAWLLPAESGEIDINDYREPESIKSRKNALHLTLADLYADTRERIARKYRAKTTLTTGVGCSEWLDDKEKELLMLVTLKAALPQTIRNAVSFALTAQWNEVIHSLREAQIDTGVFETLLAVWKKSVSFDAPIDFSETAPLFQNRLYEEFQGLANGLEENACERIRALLNIVDRFGIPIAKNSLEDRFYHILNTQISELHQSYVRAGKQSGKSKDLLLYALSFARRMNFATDRYRL